jgi:hypothetical protein
VVTPVETIYRTNQTTNPTVPLGHRCSVIRMDSKVRHQNLEFLVPQNFVRRLGFLDQGM